jgi:hypothetical protein
MASSHCVSINSIQGDPNEEETIHQSKEVMEVDQHTSLHSMGGQEE